MRMEGRGRGVSPERGAALGEATVRPPPLPCALIVLDGLGDRPHPDLEGRTPLEAARTPHLDALASLGTLGTVVTVGPGIAPESDAGVLGLLGYDPRTDSPGRGVLEAEGVGLRVRPGEVAFRFNFATVGPENVVRDARVGRSLSTAEATELAEALTRADLLGKEDVEARVIATVGHRGVVRLSSRPGGTLSPEVSNTDPFYEKVGGLGHAVKPARPQIRTVRPLDNTPEARRTADLVNRFVDRVPGVLRDHPVNVARRAKGALEANHLLLRDAGTAPKGLRTFRDRWDLGGAALTEMPVERGLAKLLELEDVFVGPVDPAHRAEGYRARAERCRELLQRQPFLYVHLKGPDEPGHDGDAPRKKEIVDALDEHFFGPFLEGLDLRRCRLLITADHATPCILKGHSDDPVPVLLVGGKDLFDPSRPGAPRSFSEATCAEGPLRGLLGRDLLVHLFERGSSRASVPTPHGDPHPKGTS